MQPIELVRLLQRLDYDLSVERKEAEFCALPSNVRNALETLWSGRHDFYKAPRSNGHWEGEAKNSLWIPDDNVVPAQRGYSNWNGLSWGEIKRKHGIRGVRFIRGVAQFGEVAKHSVRLPDFSRYVDVDDPGERSRLHDAAFAALSRQLSRPIEDVRRMKEDTDNILVWHEDVDCETLHLVPREIHDNIPHFGGIALLKILRDNGIGNAQCIMHNA